MFDYALHACLVALGMAIMAVCGNGRGVVNGVRWVYGTRRRKHEAAAADAQKRYDALRPLLLSGEITSIEYILKGHYELEYILIEGPHLKYKIVRWRGHTADGKRTYEIALQLRTAFGSPGTALKDMRRITEILVVRIRYDEQIAKLKDDTDEYRGTLTMRPANDKLLLFRIKQA